MATSKIKLISFIVIISLTTFGLTNARNCATIQKSQSTLDLVEEITSLIQAVVRILKSYQCGGNEDIPAKMLDSDELLILKNNDENNGKTLMPVIPSIPRPPDVTNHINIQLLPSFAECGSLSLRNRIKSGYKTDLYEFPWMVLLSYQTRNGQAFLCAGTLINERYVLTAAHCITNLDNRTRLESVRLGEYNISSVEDCEVEGKNTIICADPVQDILIEEVIPHPNYNIITYSNDIGLLRLSSPAQFKESVQPICLPADDSLRNRNFTNSKLVVTGWGSTEIVNISEDLLKVEIPIVPEAECKAAYSRTPALIDYRKLCGGGRNTGDSCRGDSGGPLQALETVDDDVHFIQHGIVSFGTQRCGQIGYPGVYTRVDYYMDWILDNMRA